MLGNARLKGWEDIVGQIVGTYGAIEQSKAQQDILAAQRKLEEARRAQAYAPVAKDGGTNKMMLY